MKAIIATSVASMVDQFLKPSIKILQDIGYEVVIASNFDDCGNITRERCETLKFFLREQNIQCEQIDFPRNPLKFGQVIKSYKQLSKILNTTDYSLCHCHSPIGGLVTRLVCKNIRKNGLRVIYTAHGFHFYKGAPLKNWMLYYPIEKICSRWTDVLITINTEDYEFAKKKMKAKVIEYVPGVGVDIKKFSDVLVDRDKKRDELGILKDEKMLLSVGELNENKNHKIVIEAIGKLQDPSIHYVIAGVGDQKSKLESLAKENNVNLHLLGYRKDVAELYKCADLYIHPSLREGLPVALMEAIASKLNCVCSDIRGCSDLVKKGLFIPTDIDSVMAQILRLFEEDNSVENYINLRKYDLSVVNNNMKSIYSRIDCSNRTENSYE